MGIRASSSARQGKSIGEVFEPEPGLARARKKKQKNKKTVLFVLFFCFFDTLEPKGLSVQVYCDVVNKCCRYLDIV